MGIDNEYDDPLTAGPFELGDSRILYQIFVAILKNVLVVGTVLVVSSS